MACRDKRHTSQNDRALHNDGRTLRHLHLLRPSFPQKEPADLAPLLPPCDHVRSRISLTLPYDTLYG